VSFSMAWRPASLGTARRPCLGPLRSLSSLPASRTFRTPRFFSIGTRRQARRNISSRGGTPQERQQHRRIPDTFGQGVPCQASPWRDIRMLLSCMTPGEHIPTYKYHTRGTIRNPGLSWLQVSRISHTIIPSIEVGGARQGRPKHGLAYESSLRRNNCQALASLFHACTAIAAAAQHSGGITCRCWFRALTEWQMVRIETHSVPGLVIGPRSNG